MRKLALLLSAFTTIGGCTAITVDPVSPSENISHVCIKENPRVEVSDFLHVVRDGFERHGISSEVYTADPTENCEYLMTYTALRSWDFSPYLSHAELRMEKDGLRVAYGEFHLRGKGGLSLNKWADTQTKMDPVIDEMLEQLH